MLQPTKMKGTGDLNSALTSDMEMRSLELSQLVFSTELVQYFLPMLPLHYILKLSRIYGTIILDAYDLLSDFDFTVDDN